MTQEIQAVAKLDTEGLSHHSVSLWNITRRRLMHRKSAIVGMVILATLVFVALAAQWLAPYDPVVSMLDARDYPGHAQKRQPPCIHAFGCPQDQAQHILGLDGNIRNELSRLLYGARLSLIIGLATVTFAIFIGTILGALSGYFGGWIDNVIMRVMDVLLAFPSLLLAIAIVTVLGPGLINALLAIGIVSIPAYARVVRASVLSVREMDFVAATRALGGDTVQILDPLPPHPAERSDSAHRPGNARDRQRDIGCCCAFLPWAWRAASYTRVGIHAGRRAQPSIYCSAPGFFPWYRDRTYRTFFQSAWRWFTGRARPQAHARELDALCLSIEMRFIPI